jgi:hypothetical protein
MQNQPFHPSLAGNEPRRSLTGKRGYDSKTGSEDNDDADDGDAPPAKRPNTAEGPEETEAPADGAAAVASVATYWDVFTIIIDFHDYVLLSWGWMTSQVGKGEIAVRSFPHFSAFLHIFSHRAQTAASPWTSTTTHESGKGRELRAFRLTICFNSA